MIKKKIVSGLCSCALVASSMAMPVLADAGGTTSVPEEYARHFAFDGEIYNAITTKPNGQDPTVNVDSNKTPLYADDTERGKVLNMSAGDYGIDTGYDLPAGSYTVSFWAKPIANAGDLTPTVCLDANTYNDSNGVQSQSWNRITTYGEWNEYRVLYYQTNNFESAWSKQKNDTVLNKWNLYTVTYNVTDESAGTGTLTLYFNGRKITNADNPIDVRRLAKSANVLVGINPWSHGDGLYKGYVDDMYIYTRALTESEVYHIYSGKEPTNAEATINTQENCKINVTDARPGEKVTVTVTPNEGYEAAKLNIDGKTVKLTQKKDGTATCEIAEAPLKFTVDAWADPKEGKLTMTPVTEKPAFETITDDEFGTLPTAWSDNDVMTTADFKIYPGMAIFDAGEGNEYKLDRVITYARWDMPGRAHLKIFGTNEPLSADMFTTKDGANSGKLTALTHGSTNDDFFGTGAWSNNSGGGVDAVRGEYEINGDAGYRYIIVHSDHQSMLSLGELKFYGSVVKTHSSGNFAFTTVTADQMATFNKIAVKLKDSNNKETTMAADFSSDTVFTGNGEVQAKYAINITDLPEGTDVTAVKLYTDDTTTVE